MSDFQGDAIDHGGKAPRRRDPDGPSRVADASFNQSMGVGMALSGTQEGHSAADIAQGTGPNQQRRSGVSVTSWILRRRHAVHLDGSRPQDDDSVFVTDHNLNPPPDSDSSGAFARDFEDNQPIPGYEIYRQPDGNFQRLGKGAMAVVYLARQISLKRDVAIKILPSKYSANKDYIKRFRQEGQAAAKLNHPNIVAAVDVGAVGHRHYFVMEYVDGTDVHELLKEKGKLSERRALEIIHEIALALQHAHGKGFLHRDIKPRNIMITKAGVAKLADLGLARHVDDTETAEKEKNKAFGTPYYISPEQIRGRMDIAAPADIYGLGEPLSHGDRQGALHGAQPKRSHEGPSQRGPGSPSAFELRFE